MQCLREITLSVFCSPLKQRRCIHDEHGNEDPVKAREAAMPRPAAAHKRRKHDSDGNEIPSAKKLRRSTGSLAQDHFDDTSTRTDSDVQYPQQAPVANMVPSAPVNETQYQTQHHFPSALDQMQAAAAAFESNTSIGTDDQALEHAEIDLATDYPVASGAHSKTVLTESAPHTPFDMSLADPIVSIPPDRKEDIPLDPAIVAASNLTSSLVSPPASERQEADDVAPSPPATSSRHSSIQPPQQRYTPASESRRASSSSTNNESGRASSGPTTGGKEVSPITTISTAGEDDKREVGSGSPVEKRKSRGSVEAIADEESLRLIKELQAADLGLRRRGRA